MPTQDTSRSGPLSGMRVVEMAGKGPAPYCGMMLSDMGADVVRIDRISTLSRRYVHYVDPMSRGRRSIAVDLKTPAGVATIRRLVALSDCLIEGYRPGVMERLGFGYTAVAARNPGVVFLSISGVGPKGPYAKKRVYDPTIQALTGFTDIQADPITRRPKMVRTLVADKTTAIYAAQAVTAALLAPQFRLLPAAVSIVRMALSFWQKAS